jgi:hypothetical protein
VRPSEASSQRAQNLVRFGVPPRLFFREQQLVAERHLEGPAAGWNQDDFVELVFKLRKYPFRQTDGLRCVTSLRAVLD